MSPAMSAAMSSLDVGLRGWIPVATSADLPDGGVIPLRVQGDELVLWRGDSGQPHALEAFCQHLGAHLGYKGRVHGEDIRCFYHEWTWSPAGENTDIPYDSRVHKGRRIRPWYAQERNGVIFLWHPGPGGEGEPARPAPEPSLEPARTWTSREFVADPRLFLEALVEPATLGLLPTGRILSSEVASSSGVSGSEFRVVHRCENSPSHQGAVLEVAVLDVATAVVTGSGWTLAIAICPVIEGSVVVRISIVGLQDEFAAALDRLLLVIADARYLPLPDGVGDEPLRSYRAWVSGLATTSA